VVALNVMPLRNSMNAEGFDGILNDEWILDFDGAFDDAYENQMVEYEEKSRDALSHNAAVRLPLLSNSLHR
jgi:hypothetical protein